MEDVSSDEEEEEYVEEATLYDEDKDNIILHEEFINAVQEKITKEEEESDELNYEEISHEI